MQPYKHRQFGTLMVSGLGTGLIMILIVLIKSPSEPARTISWSVFLLVAVCLLLFWSLTVEVKPDHLRVYFGFGIIHKRFPFSEILDARVVKTPWYYGWGVRPAPHGWMFNVSGFGGVELILKDNGCFRIGTDQACQLLTAIRRQIMY